MRLHLWALLDKSAPPRLRQRGLLQLSLLALLLQGFHLLLAHWTLPDLRGAPAWAAWGVGVFWLLCMGLVLQVRLRSRSPHRLVHQALLDALWLGAGGLGALLLDRLGQPALALGFLGLGLLGYGAGLWQLWQALPPGGARGRGLGQ
ncbi:hypothetical protein DV704_05360 [Meiothermus sp. QL-1]|uniref:hypothetical protein n=1 Tax=Meiothermus sp. QL-1 TaxID=2058095 RepID=UPI000E0A74B3|nr:hypothetical protein [Meiothermus sp. QL-1]RDI95703.1 hypothetical protein DV704_05360 [Meiothermus sp. QL-1]